MTSKEERKIRMRYEPSEVSRKVRIAFPIVCTFIVGLIAHKCAKINETNDKKYIFRWSLIATVAGLGFNVFADPIVGYFYKQYLLGIPQEVADIWVKINGMTTLVNAVLSAVLAMILYAALRPALIKANLLHVDVKTK